MSKLFWSILQSLYVYESKKKSEKYWHLNFNHKKQEKDPFSCHNFKRSTINDEFFKELKKKFYVSLYVNLLHAKVAVYWSI